jgi:type I restriction enzyme S subunit
MKKGWETKKLSALYQIGSSKRVLKSQWKTSGVPFYRGREVTRLAAQGFVDNELFISEGHFAELSKEYGVPKAGDIVITAIGTIGNAHVVRGSDRFYFKDASVLWMKRTADVSSEFVNWWLKSPAFFGQLNRGNGATVDTLTIQTLQRVELHLPPLPEQLRIVTILDAAIEAVATAKANSEKNLQNARAIFESHLQSVFSQRGKGWVDTTLGKVLAVQPQNGWSPPAANHSSCGTPVLTLSSVTGFRFRPDKIKFTSAPTDSRRHYWVKNGDFLITRSNTPELVGHVAIAKGISKATIYPDLIMRMNTMPERMMTEFLYYQLRTPALRKEITGRAQGANPTMKKISNGAVKTLPIAVPPIAKQDEIVGKLNAIAEETQRLVSIYERKLEALDALKEALLDRAFSGELVDKNDATRVGAAA